MGGHDNDDVRLLSDVEACFSSIAELVSQDRESVHEKIQEQLDRAVEVISNKTKQQLDYREIAASSQKVRNYYYMHPEQIRHLIEEATYNYRAQHASTPSQGRVAACERLNDSKPRDGRLLLVEIIRARDAERSDHREHGKLRMFVPSKLPWPRCGFARAMDQLLQRMLIDEQEEKFLVAAEPVLSVVYRVLDQFRQVQQPLVRELRSLLRGLSVADMHSALLNVYHNDGAQYVENSVGVSLSAAIKAYAEDDNVVLDDQSVAVESSLS